VTNLYIRIQTMVYTLLNKEEGQDLLEYALLGGLIAAGIIAGFLLFDDAVLAMVTEIGQCIDFNGGTVCNPGP
jgi:Flp pilus assembly pilin Flp